MRNSVSAQWFVTLHRDNRGYSHRHLLVVLISYFYCSVDRLNGLVSYTISHSIPSPWSVETEGATNRENHDYAHKYLIPFDSDLVDWGCL